MSLLTLGAASAIPSPPLCHLPGGPSHFPVLVVVAGSGRDLDRSSTVVATVLRQATHGRLVQLLLHGGDRSADRAIERCHRLGWAACAMPAQWDGYGPAAGPVRNGPGLIQSLSQDSAESKHANHER